MFLLVEKNLNDKQINNILNYVLSFFTCLEQNFISGCSMGQSIQRWDWCAEVQGINFMYWCTLMLGLLSLYNGMVEDREGRLTLIGTASWTLYSRTLPYDHPISMTTLLLWVLRFGSQKACWIIFLVLMFLWSLGGRINRVPLWS